MTWQLPRVADFTHVGLECCVTFGRYGWNGYVRIPADWPERPLGEAYEEHKRNDPELKAQRAKWGIPEPWGGYNSCDILDDINVHGGLTYGIDPDGWVGFDTAHAFDDVDVEEVEAVLPSLSPRQWEEWQYSKQRMGELGIGWPPGKDIAGIGGVPYRVWNIARVVAETQQLAEQLVARHLIALPVIRNRKGKRQQ